MESPLGELGGYDICRRDRSQREEQRGGNRRETERLATGLNGMARVTSATRHEAVKSVCSVSRKNGRCVRRISMTTISVATDSMKPAASERLRAGIEVRRSTPNVRKSKTLLISPKVTMKLRMSRCPRRRDGGPARDRPDRWRWSWRQVGKEVDQQDLEWQERQERQKEVATGHAGHVPEVRTDRHEHILERVGERLAARRTPSMNTSRSFSSSTTLGGVPGDIGGGVDGDPDIGRMKCRRIVDPVAQESRRLGRTGEARGRSAPSAGDRPRRRPLHSATTLRKLSVVEAR